MKLKVIGCSSAGNAFLVEQGGKSLLLDAGVSYHKILSAIAFDLMMLDGVLVSHEHIDHVLSVQKLNNAGVSVITSKGTSKAIPGDVRFQHTIIKSKEVIQHISWKIMAFEVHHDAVEPLGFVVKHNDTDKKLCYLPDSGYSQFSPTGITDLIIECNYMDEKLEELLDQKTTYSLNRYNRLKHSHMSLSRCIKQIASMDRENMKNIILTHLSDENSDEIKMVNEVRAKFGINVVAAHDGMTIYL